MMKEIVLISQLFESIDGHTVNCEVLTRSEYKKMEIQLPVQELNSPFTPQSSNSTLLLNYNNILPEYRFDNFIL